MRNWHSASIEPLATAEAVTEGKTGARLKVLAFLCAFMFAALGVRLWFVQVLASTQYRDKAQNNGTRLVPVPALDSERSPCKPSAFWLA